MLYASAKTVHLLGIVAWVGGMFFMLACLRPAAAVLEPPARVRLMQATLRRFFNVVAVAIVCVLASGGAMIGIAAQTALQAGLAFNMPLTWYVMTILFVVMALVFVHLRWRLFPRVEQALGVESWPKAAAALGAIRWAVMLNLVLGIFIVVVVRLGGSS